MDLKNHPSLEITQDLLEAIKSFPVRRTVEHCGAQVVADPFDFYVSCPQCGARLKVRSLSGIPELEDVFDAVFEWMNDPEGQAVAKRRQTTIEEDE